MTLTAFATEHNLWPWARQTEDGQTVGRTRFDLQGNSAQAQWLMVMDEPPAGYVTLIPKCRRVLFLTEPPEVKLYPPSYLKQFGTVVSPFGARGVTDACVIRENPCYPWHLGVEITDGGCKSMYHSLNDFRDMPVPLKNRGLSVICSNKAITSAQRKRIAFVEKLQARFGDAVDAYGRGRKPISDKAQAILPYKYHLVLENSYLENSWTEKLSDTWLGYAYPIYLGAPNIESCCPSGGLLNLQPDNDEANLDAIEKLLREDPWERSLPAIRNCRQWVLETTNIFARMDRLIHEADANTCSMPNLKSPEPLRKSSRWQRALLRHAMRFGLYNPFA